jgi:hypothetical protein
MASHASVPVQLAVAVQRATSTTPSACLATPRAMEEASSYRRVDHDEVKHLANGSHRVVNVDSTV